jgi:hypothetical protein
LRRAERVLTGCLVLLKLQVLYRASGHLEGFDADPWLDVFRATHWFRPLPGPRSLFLAYHPPLSFLVARLIYAVYPHEVQASQIVSTLAMIGATFALRDTLRTMGILWTLPGLVMLYVTASLPLVVWLAIETSDDALVFMWFTLGLAVSARLFWSPLPAGWWKRPRRLVAVVFLGLVLAAGLFTKFNAFFALPLPFLVIFARRGLAALLREAGAAVAAVALATVLVGPFYVSRYYLPLHALFPSNMDWIKAKDLKVALARRDANRWGFWLHLLRVPAESVTGASSPVRDSFFHSLWLQLWKRDVFGLGKGRLEGPVAVAVSNFYVRIFPVFMAVSASLICLSRRRLPAVWRTWGLVVVVVFVTYCGGLMSYAWKYPLWEWTPLKAKYVAPGVLWIGYCAALPFVNRSTAPVSPWLGRVGTAGGLLAVVVFMFVNHLLPVY